MISGSGSRRRRRAGVLRCCACGQTTAGRQATVRATCWLSRRPARHLSHRLRIDENSRVVHILDIDHRSIYHRRNSDWRCLGLMRPTPPASASIKLDHANTCPIDLTASRRPCLPTLADLTAAAAGWTHHPSVVGSSPTLPTRSALRSPLFEASAKRLDLRKRRIPAILSAVTIWAVSARGSSALSVPMCPGHGPGPTPRPCTNRSPMCSALGLGCHQPDPHRAHGRGVGLPGFRIQWKRKRGTNKSYVYTFIADRPIRSLKAKIELFI